MAIGTFRSILLVCSAVAVVAILAGKTLPAQRVCCQGDSWLQWTEDAREKYVWGYTIAYTKGYGTACRKMDAEWNGPVKPGYENAPLNKCLQGQPDFSKGTGYLVKSITDFYHRHPEDRDIYPDEILEQLGKGLSIEEIHKYPFWRHTPPPNNP